jgi:hypothetical protein
MTDDAILSLADGWEEAGFDRDAFGPEDREGLVATLTREDATVEALPVRYRRQDGVETVTALTEDWEGDRQDPTVPVHDVDPTTAFATRLTYTPFDTVREEVVCVAGDPGDALAVGAWLAGASADARELRRHVNNHAGSGAPTGVPLSDDDVLAAAFAEDPGRCVFTAKETRSHSVRLPFRYAPLLSAARRTGHGVPRFPSTIGGLEGVVSHAAWDEHDLHDVDFEAPIERVDAGEYRLDEAVVDAVAGTDAEAYALQRLGGGD